MRRKDRETDEAFALTVVDKCEWAVLSTIDPEGEPYCLPITIVREGRSIYFHAATTGLKSDCLRKHARVCLACVGDTRRLTDRFTTEYEAAVVRGDAALVNDDGEKIHALRLLCQRHTPANMAAFDKAIELSLSRTAVWRIAVVSVSGKRKKYDADGNELSCGRQN